MTRLELAPFYQKYVSAQGIPVLGSHRVSDFALQEAAYLAVSMLAERPVVLDSLVESRVRVVVMAHDETTADLPEHEHLSACGNGRIRGQMGGRDGVLVLVGEENLLAYPGDPYEGESIFVHELAHAIADKALAKARPSFRSRVVQAYEEAMRKGLWGDHYASTNPFEYWAELVQSWFDANREHDHDHNHVNTRAELVQYDPTGASVVRDFLGDNDFRFVDRRARRTAGHLRGLYRTHLPEFSWPAAVLEEDARAQKGQPHRLPALPPITWRQSPSVRGGERAMVYVHNERSEAVVLHWIDFKATLKPMLRIRSGRRHDLRGFAGSCYLATDDHRTPLAHFCAEPGTSEALVK